MQNSNPEANNPTVEFTFGREVTNAGVLRKAGDKVDMPKAVAERLKSAGHGDYANAKK